MTKILSIESSSEVCSVALHSIGKLISIKESSEKNNHSKTLATFVATILDENKLSVFDLAAISVSGGPGSYTGLRIGVSLAKGLCYASGKPLIQVNSLKSLAFKIKTEISNVSKNTVFIPMIDARRMEVYLETFDCNLNSLSPAIPVIIDKEFFNSLNNEKIYYIGGNGAFKIDKKNLNDTVKKIENISFSADSIGVIAYEKFINNEFENIAEFEPLYLKLFTETLKK